MGKGVDHKIIINPVSCNLGFPSCPLGSFRLLSGSGLEVSAIGTTHLWKRKTSTASQAKPGDYQLDLSVNDGTTD